MSIEIEAKMSVSHVGDLESRLQAVGAERGPVVMEINTYFDTPRGSLRAEDRGLRLRIEQQAQDGRRVVTITHKGPRAHGKLKSRSETELIVADASGAAELLISLGYVSVLTFEKRRRRWEVDECHIGIDTLPYLGHFIEIEGPSQEVVLATREKLGYTSAPLIRPSYIAMLKTYMAEHQITTDWVCLEDAPAQDGPPDGVGDGVSASGT